MNQSQMKRLSLIIMCVLFAGLKEAFADVTYAPGKLSLTEGKSIQTGSVKLVMQTDGNLVVYNGNTAVWSSETYGKCKACLAVFQTDGNLVVYNRANGKPLYGAISNGSTSFSLLSAAPFMRMKAPNFTWYPDWSKKGMAFAPGKFSLTEGQAIYIDLYSFVMQRDGGFYVYNRAKGGNAVWTANTWGKCARCLVTFQTDGNFVVYNRDNSKAVYATQSNGATQMVLTQKSPYFTFIKPVVKAAVQAAPVAATTFQDGCQSGSLCVHAVMPLVKQGNTEGTLYAQLSGRYGIAVSSIRDNFCAPAAGAMLMRAAAIENGTQSSNSYLRGPASMPTVLNLIGAMQTNITGGGTQVPMVYYAISAVAAQELNRGSVLNAIAPITDVNYYRATRPLQMITVQLATGSWHTVAINGSEGSYFKIFDPAGRVYNVKPNGFGFAYVNSSYGGAATYFSSTIFKDTVTINGY